MRYVKFTAVKLIIHYVILTCFVFFVFSENCVAKQKFAVQIAASKTPLNILDFAERKQIDDSIIVIKSELWNRYVVGNFENKEMASAYALELIQKTKLTNAFVLVIEDDIESAN